MITYFNCSLCGHTITADDTPEGRVVECDHCGKAVTVPRPTREHSRPDRNQHEKSVSVFSDDEAPEPSDAYTVQVIESDATLVQPEVPALVQQLPAQAPAESRLVRYVMGFLTVGILVAAYIGYDPLTVAKIASKLSATGASGEGGSDSPTLSDIPAATNAKTDADARARLLATATAMVESIQTVDASIEKKISYDQYVGVVVGLHAAINEFLGTVKEAGMVGSDVDVQQLCKLASAIAEDHSQALEKWKQEIAIEVERKEVRAAHEARINAATDMAAINRSLQLTTLKLDQLTGQSMAAIEARYDLWIDAQKQAKIAAEILSRWNQSVPPR